MVLRVSSNYVGQFYVVSLSHSTVVLHIRYGPGGLALYMYLIRNSTYSVWCIRPLASLV